MAIARDQIPDIYQALRKVLGPGTITLVIQELSKTTAYRQNRSFHDTLDRLLAHQQNILDGKVRPIRRTPDSGF